MGFGFNIAGGFNLGNSLSHLVGTWGQDLQALGTAANNWLEQGSYPIFGPVGGPSQQQQPPSYSPGIPNILGAVGGLPASGAGGSGGSSAAAGPAGYFTPDGVFISNGSSSDTYYKLIDAAWTKTYGQHAPFALVQTMRNLGVQNTSQVNTIMNQLPSHIQNPDGSMMPIGQYNDIYSTGQQLSDKYFGRPISDAVIKDWVKQGVTSPEAIDLWFQNHPATDIPQDVYGQIFDQASQWTQATFNDLPHPSNVNAIYNQMNAQGVGI
jgi:hypothetical protein